MRGFSVCMTSFSLFASSLSFPLCIVLQNLQLADHEDIEKHPRATGVQASSGGHSASAQSASQCGAGSAGRLFEIAEDRQLVRPTTSSCLLHSPASTLRVLSASPRRDGTGGALPSVSELIDNRSTLGVGGRLPATTTSSLAGAWSENRVYNLYLLTSPTVQPSVPLLLGGSWVGRNRRAYPRGHSTS